MTAVPKIPMRRMTLEEFVALGEGPPYYEFEDGLIFPRNGGPDPMVSPKSRHQRMLAAVMPYCPLMSMSSSMDLGEVFSLRLTCILSNGRKLYIPDITFVAANGGARI